MKKLEEAVLEARKNREWRHEKSQLTEEEAREYMRDLEQQGDGLKNLS